MNQHKTQTVSELTHRRKFLCKNKARESGRNKRKVTWELAVLGIQLFFEAIYTKKRPFTEEMVAVVVMVLMVVVIQKVV